MKLFDNYFKNARNVRNFFTSLKNDQHKILFVRPDFTNTTRYLQLANQELILDRR